MEKQKLVYMEAALTLTGLIDEYILNFGFRKRRIGKDGKEIINQTLEKKADMLTEASMIDEWEQDSIVYWQNIPRRCDKEIKEASGYPL